MKWDINQQSSVPQPEVSSPDSPTTHLRGFSQPVQLGQTGEVLQVAGLVEGLQQELVTLLPVPLQHLSGKERSYAVRFTLQEILKTNGVMRQLFVIHNDTRTHEFLLLYSQIPSHGKKRLNEQPVGNWTTNVKLRSSIQHDCTEKV